MSEPQMIDEAEELCRRLEPEPRHVHHVCQLALLLFDQLVPVHGLDAQDRLLLHAASLLHDLGFSTYPSGKGHHKESARLIRAHPWKQLLPQQVEIVAQVARYHRKSLPSPEHEAFAALSRHDQRRVESLAALLRIADGLDRTHAQNTKQITVSSDDHTIHIQAQGVAPLSANLAAAEKKSDLARRIFDREVRIQ
jgi:exopolyphosphatase/guanosine-5'-triphosphate,3'-diphosphate pyrophosphatase